MKFFATLLLCLICVSFQAMEACYIETVSDQGALGLFIQGQKHKVLHNLSVMAENSHIAFDKNEDVRISLRYENFNRSQSTCICIVTGEFEYFDYDGHDKYPVEIKETIKIQNKNLFVELESKYSSCKIS